MDVRSSIRVLLKRWYIVAVGATLTVAAALLVNLMIEPRYTARGSVVLSVPPNLPERAESANPFLAYGNLEVPAKVVASAMNQPSLVREQEANGAEGDFVVDLDPERSTPIITIDSEARTARQAIKTVEVVTAGVQKLLNDRQEALGAPPNTRITANQLIAPEEANEAIGSKLRALSAVLVIGGVLTLSLAFAVEGWAAGGSPEATAAPSVAAGAAVAPPRPRPAGAEPADDDEQAGWRRLQSLPAGAAASGRPTAAAPAPARPESVPAAVGTCPLCGTGFRSAPALTRHLQGEHELGATGPAAAARRAASAARPAAATPAGRRTPTSSGTERAHARRRPGSPGTPEG